MENIIQELFLCKLQKEVQTCKRGIWGHFSQVIYLTGTPEPWMEDRQLGTTSQLLQTVQQERKILLYEFVSEESNSHEPVAIRAV